MVDPTTGLLYSGFLTPDAQTLYNAGSLVIPQGNQLTAQGSALAAQGDLITGTPAPTTAQVAAASATAAASTDPWTNFSAWLTEETYWSGVPNGALLAGGVILAALMFGGKKGRR